MRQKFEYMTIVTVLVMTEIKVDTVIAAHKDRLAQIQKSKGRTRR